MLVSIFVFSEAYNVSAQNDKKTAPQSLKTLTRAVEYRYRVVARHPHDDRLFTQGLEFKNGIVFESSGHYGQSKLLTRDLKNTQVIAQRHLKQRYFAEGLTVLNNKIYQLTWRARRGFVYERDHLQVIGDFHYKGEGWGLCNDGQSLIISNGSARLQYINPLTFKPERSILVTLNGQPLSKLNELEWVDGLIYANIWQSDWMVMINPITGHVVGRVDLSTLLTEQQQRNANVLNGIAYDSQQKRLFVTGKYWPTLFEIELIAP